MFLQKCKTLKYPHMFVATTVLRNIKISSFTARGEAEQILKLKPTQVILNS
jgi:hypothetical protein